MYNRVILMGRITHDLELKQTPSGVNVCTFSVAVDRRFQTKGEDKKTDFFNIVAWRQTAEFVTKYFAKGRLILVEGELQTRQYTDKNGQNVRAVEVLAEQVSFTGEKKAEIGEPTPAQSQTAQASPADFSAADKDDDYPF